jgi:hypothetical protein
VLVLGALLALLPLDAASGCRTTNIESRPDWAKAPRLQPENPLFPQYPPDRYLTTVAMAEAPSLQESIDGAKKNAIDAFTETISGQVTALAGAGGSAREGGAYREKVAEMVAKSRGDVAACVENVLGWDGFNRDQKLYFGCYAFDKARAGQLIATRAAAALDQVETIGRRLEDPALAQGEAERLAIEMLQSLLELSVLKQQCVFLDREVAWIQNFGKVELACAERVYDAGRRRERSGTEDDLVEAKKFYDEAAKLRQDPLIDASIDRVAARLPCPRCKPALAFLKEKVTSIEEARRRIGALGEAEETERLALEGIKAVDDLRDVLKHPHAFFKERMGTVEDFTPFENDCVRRVYAAGERLERAGTERDLEQALKYYEDSVRIRKDSVLAGRILEVKRRLPCTECGRGAKCVICAGARGKNVTCGTCNGSQRVPATCPVCRGDGRDECRRCGRSGQITVQCNVCDRGKVVCAGCNGTGKFQMACGTCGGRGVQSCPNMVFDHRACGYCRGSRQVTCGTCRGSGRSTSNCFGCFGTGRASCTTCGGTAVLNVTCDQCGGAGRSGICPRCRGDRTVLNACTSCRGGFVWEDCRRCRGSGVCPTCQGRAHRQ